MLHAVYITAHKEAQERRLELKRMQQADPRTRLITNEKVWNLGVIDNIDFKQDTFKYGNIYDYSRNTVHATLRMVFQFTLPVPIINITNTRALILPNGKRQLFGYNSFSLEIIDIFEFVLKN